MRPGRPPALIISALCAAFSTTLALTSVTESRAAEAGHHSHRHHRADAGASTAAPASSPSHGHHVRALLAKLKEQEAQLYALRHERNVLSMRTKHLAKQLSKHKRSRRVDADAEAENINSAPESSAHQRRLRKLHVAALEAQQAHEAHVATLRQAEAEHNQHLAALKSQHLQHLAAAKAQHEVRVAALQAHEDKLREQKIAAQEAQRELHSDKPNPIVDVASGTRLPIWQGNAYAAQVPVKVVTVNLNDPKVKVSALLARDGIGTSEPFTQMIDRAHPNVAVTGTFFSLDNLRPVGDIVIDGSLAYFGGMGTALAITPGNRADMITLPYGHHHNWSGYDTVVACGPRLLSDGAITLDPHMEHFKDHHMLAPNSRIAVGITGHNQLIFAMTRDPIYLGRLAKVMRSLGCKEAMNLDAGTSTGFYCNGNLMARPGRRLTNAIVVYANRKSDRVDDNDTASIRKRAPQHIAAARVTLAAHSTEHVRVETVAYMQARHPGR